MIGAPMVVQSGQRKRRGRQTAGSARCARRQGLVVGARNGLLETSRGRSIPADYAAGNWVQVKE
jgi:hypothetical protein